MALYRLDDEVRAMLRLEEFGDANFSTRKFMEQLNTQQSRGNEEFDPKPYIRTLEAVAGELVKLLDTVNDQDQATELEIQELVEAHNHNIVDMSSNVDSVMNEVNSLDHDISEFSRATNILGDRVERVSKEFGLIRDSRFVLKCYFAFVDKGMCTELEKLWTTTDLAEQRHYAQTVGLLQAFVRQTGQVASRPDLESLIDKFAERLELHFAELFQTAFSAFDLAGMRTIARIMDDFNGGAGIVQQYVNQHDFFIQVSKVDEASVIHDKKLWKQLADPLAEYPDFINLVKQLVDEIAQRVTSETDVIAQIFPKPVLVLSVFMQRTFAQRIQGQVIQWHQEAESRSPLARIRVTYECYRQIGLLVRTLKDLWSRNPIDSDGELSTMLDHCFSDVFTMLSLENFFQTVEIPCLQEITCTFLKLDDAAADRNGDANDDEPQPASPLPTREPQSPSRPVEEDGERRLDKFIRAVRLERSKSVWASNKWMRNANERDIRIDIHAVSRALAAFTEAVGHEQVLSTASEIPADAASLFNLLMETLGSKYINASLETTLRQLRSTDVKLTVSFNFLVSLKQATLAVRLCANFVRAVLLGMLIKHDEMRTRIAQYMDQYLTSVKELCQDVLDQAVTLASNRIAAIFAKRRRRDYSSKEIDPGESPFCHEVYTMLCDLHEHATANLSATSCAGLLGEVAEVLVVALNTQIKRYSVSVAGGAMFCSDVEKYQRLLVDEWSLKALEEPLQTLLAIAKLLAAPTNYVASVLRDGQLAKLRPGALKEYTALRSDYHSASLGVHFVSKSGYQYPY